MRSKPGLKTEPDGFERWVEQNAQQRIIILDSAPTAAIPQIRESDLGYYSNKVYFMIGGVLKEFSVSSTA